uniref:Uncharacterized protein n=1 Tax=Megaselia scalaris TaxID=36166 RepID=T1GH62_MEGSC
MRRATKKGSATPGGESLNMLGRSVKSPMNDEVSAEQTSSTEAEPEPEPEETKASQEEEEEDAPSEDVASEQDDEENKTLETIEIADLSLQCMHL